MATLENFRPGPALDFSSITNAINQNRTLDLAREKLRIDEEIRRGTLSVAEGNLALKQLEAQTAATQTQQLGGLSGELANLTGGDTGVQPQTTTQGGLDALVTSQLGGVAQGQDVVPSAPQATAPAPVQRQPARVLSGEDISKATKIFNRMERVKPGSSQGFRDVLKFGNDLQIAAVERDRKKQRGRAFQMKGKPLDQQRRILAQFRAEDEATGEDISEIEKMQRMDQDALNIEIDTDLFLDKNIDEALKIAGTPKTELRKLQLDQQAAVSSFGADSPQAKAFEEAIKAESEGEGPSLKDESSMRKEFTKASGDFVKLNDAIKKVLSASPNAAGDLALTFSFMKILDPGSVVRESEQATVRNARGVPESIRQTWNKLLVGESLDIEQRARFKAEAQKIFTSQISNQLNLEKEFTRISTISGIDPKKVIVDFIADFRPKADGKKELNISEMSDEQLLKGF